MRTVLKLAVAFLREHPNRVVLTSIATVLSVCVVVWVVSSYDALLLTFDEFSEKALGRYNLSVAPISMADDKSVPQEAVDALRADPLVAGADAMWAQRVPFRVVSPGLPPPALEPVKRPGGAPPGGGPGGPPGGGAPGDPTMGSPDLGPPEVMLLGTSAPEAPFSILRGRWIDPQRPDALEATISAEAARRLGADLGGEVSVGKGEKSRTLRIVGVVDSPPMAGGYAPMLQLPSPSTGGLHVPMALAARIVGRPSGVTFVGVSLKPEANLTRFRFGWAPKLGRFSPPVQFQEAHDIEEALDQSAAAQNVKILSYATTGIAMLVAFLVVFGTLSMGVNERVRQFAILRAVVLTRGQVGLMIVMESLLLATIGFAGGLLVGGSLLSLVGRVFARLLRHGAVLGMNSILLAAAAAYGGALLAALLPAYRATRVRPLDAMAPQPQSAGGKGTPIAIVLAGLLLISVNPLLTFVFPPAFEGQVVLSMAVGFATMAIGFVLLAPVVVAFVDRAFGPLLARLLGIEPRLMASQITSHLWRTVAAAIALTVGLGLFIGIQVWGFTMLDGFVPGPWAPDALIAFTGGGLPPEKAVSVAQFHGVDPARCLPIVVEQPRLLDDITNSAERPSIIRQDNVIIVGLDPARGLGGQRPLLKMEWVEGSAEAAVAMMEKGRACVVPDHFLRETGLKMGDGFMLVPPEDAEHPVRYTIAGAVRLLGWHWQTKHTGFRPRTHRAAALVFADYASVSKDFGLPTATHVWLSCNGGTVDADSLGREAQALYSQVLKRDVALGRAPEGEPAVSVMPVERLRSMVLGAAQQWIWIISILPLVALVIACFGVLNVILASVRARRWDMGVLRALGFTRGTLVRMIVAEGILIGIVAGLLSLGFGILGGWCGCGFAQYISFFGGMHPLLVIPWLPVAVGLLLVLVLSALTAVWPAVSIGRARPLTLLQQGRSAF